MPYVLDTDTTTALQHKNLHVVKRVSSLPPSGLFFTIVSFEEQCQGRLAVLNRQLTQTARIEAYQRLRETLDFYKIVNVLPYDERAAVIDARLLAARRIGTMDRRIAAITLAHGHTLVTHNTVHFSNVPGLVQEDWITP